MGKFKQRLRLHAFPFDHQWIGVTIRFVGKRVEKEFQVHKNSQRA